MLIINPNAKIWDQLGKRSELLDVFTVFTLYICVEQNQATSFDIERETRWCTIYAHQQRSAQHPAGALGAFAFCVRQRAVCACAEPVAYIGESGSWKGAACVECSRCCSQEMISPEQGSWWRGRRPPPEQVRDFALDECSRPSDNRMCVENSTLKLSPITQNGIYAPAKRSFVRVPLREEMQRALSLSVLIATASLTLTHFWVE